LFVRLREVDMGFRGICISMGGFFGVVLIVFGFVY